MITQTHDSSSKTSLLLEPNQSLSAENCVSILVGASIVFVLIAVAFISLGVWLIVPFIFFELVLLVIVFGVVQFRCRAKERLSITADRVLLEKLADGHLWSWCFERSNLSLLIVKDEMNSIRNLSLGGTAGLVEVGEFLTDAELKVLLSDLQQSGLRAKTPSLDSVMSC
ncbi:MAG: DUF2244 domain-containing protein [Cellvibrionaceae bacterium]